MDTQPTPAERQELLLEELETWKGREAYAQRQQERIRVQLGVLATSRHLILLQGGLDQPSAGSSN
jgi:hypothetical protein